MWGKQTSHEPEVTCSEVSAPDIYIEVIPRQKITYLMEEYPHQEWLAYLIGKLSDGANFFVEDISIPPHKEAHAGSAEAEPFHIPPNCIGIIHSHHSLGAFHSDIDRVYVDKNFPVSITVAINKGNLVYDAVSYQKTPCGKPIKLNCNVKYVQPPPLFDKEAFLKEAKKNIDKGKSKETGMYSFDVPYCTFVPDKEKGGYVPLEKKNKQVSMKKSVTNKQVEEIRRRLKEVYGVDVTRAEAEDLALDDASFWEEI